MSGKKLLAENTIRRFMRLANVEPLTDKFISEMAMKDEEDDEREMPPVNEVEEEEMPEEEVEMDDEEPGMEDEVEMDAEDLEGEGEEMGAADISLTEEEASLLIDLGERLADAMEMGDDPMADEEPMDDEEPMGDEMDAEMDAEGEEEPGMRDYSLQEKNQIVQEVLRRVTKRILARK